MRSAYELARRPLASRICLVFANLIDFPHVLPRARRSSSMMALWRSYSPDEARGAENEMLVFVYARTKQDVAITPHDLARATDFHGDAEV